MKQCYGILFFLIILFKPSFGQNVPLFQKKEIINIRISGSIKSIKKKSNDSTFVSGKFQYDKGNDQWATIPTKARVRGNYRLRNCYFPPIKLKFNKKEVASTLFEGNKALKLVVPCKISADKNTLIRKEYLCYQFYQVLSPYYFRTRLANLALTEISQKKPRSYELLSFFVEDNSMVAKRGNGKVIEKKGINPGAFDEKQSLRNDFFQYMIGNADWSAVFQHNSNTLFVDGKYIPLSYDFDMAGFVNAGYSHDNPPTLGTGDPRERVYRGFCKSEPAMQEIRKEYLEKESSLHALIDQHETFFTKYELKDMHGYLDAFFEMLKNDSLFKNSIVESCRKK
ncbi:MAG TPA: hypothetical protein PLJ60_01975 [Chryseolinea sp.]|nr:hypothetical protein [Chryseolinea sp.]HPM29077.1 hypothetical protein [Chryseolinea sp.]